MAHHLAPLYNLLKNSKSKTQFNDWNDRAVQALNSKKRLAEATTLAFPSSNLPTQIVVDASDWKLDATQQKYSLLIENCFQHTRRFGIFIT